MDTRLLGRTGLKVSQLCFGTMSFGGDADAAGSAAMYAACRERGINFFDCADAYSKGKAEQILGRLMAHERDDLIVTTKCFNPTGPDVNAAGANRRHITRAVEASLTRLGAARVTVLFMPRWDGPVPLEGALRGPEDRAPAGTGAGGWSGRAGVGPGRPRGRGTRSGIWSAPARCCIWAPRTMPPGRSPRGSASRGAAAGPAST